MLQRKKSAYGSRSQTADSSWFLKVFVNLLDSFSVFLEFLKYLDLELNPLFPVMTEFCTSQCASDSLQPSKIFMAATLQLHMNFSPYRILLHNYFKQRP